MAVVTTGQWQKALWPGVYGWFNERYDTYVPEFEAIFDMRTSNKQWEQTVGQSGLGQAKVKPQGSPIEYDDTQQTYVNQYENEVWALGVIITLEMVRRNQYNIQALRNKPEMLADSLNESREINAINVLNNGFDGAYTMGSASDGVALFSSAHPSGPYGDDRSNLLTAADLSETTLEDACIQIAGAVDPRGNRIKLMERELIIPRQLKFIAERIMKSSLQNDTANNAINALKSTGAVGGGYRIMHYLTDQDAWFLTTNINEQGKGLAHYTEWAQEFASENEFDTFNMKCRGSESYSNGWDDFLGIFGNAGA